MDEKITIEQIKTPEFLKSTKEKLEEFLNYDSGKEAWLFEMDLEKVLRENPDFVKNSPDLFNQYEDLILKMKLIALRFLQPDNIVATLKDHFSVMLLSFPPVTNDIVDKLTSRLVGIPVYEERDELKTRILKILVESQEKITTDNIVDDTGSQQLPTINNWISDYLRELKGAEGDSFHLTNYLYNTHNVAKLTDKERETLKALFTLYEFLKKSSLTPEGLEESILVDDNGVLKILDHGQLEIVPPIT